MTICGAGDVSKCSSPIVFRSEFLRPLTLFSEFDVDSGPKRHEAQDSGRSLVAIREMRECFTISGRRRIVSKICSLSVGKCVAGESGPPVAPPGELAAPLEDLKLIALSGSSLVDVDEAVFACPLATLAGAVKEAAEGD